MLNKYREYLEPTPEVLNEEAAMIKPDPPGMGKIYNTKSYHADFNALYMEALNKAKTAAEAMAAKLKQDFKSKIISFLDENGRQKIVMVEDVIVENKGNDYYPVIFEDKDRKFKFKWEIPEQSTIFDVGRFLEFFEDNYMDKLIQFTGKFGKGGGKEMKFMKQVVRVGIHTGQAQDYLTVECDDKTTQLLNHMEPIKLVNPRMKLLDPYNEENWDN